LTLHLTGADDTRDVSAAFKRRAKRISDWRPVFESTESVIGEAFRANIRTEGASSGDPWPPLSPPYAAAKERAGFGNKMMIRTGAFVAAVGRARHFIDRKSKTGALFGVAGGLGLRYPYMLQAGSAFYPPRLILEWTGKTTRALEENTAKHIAGELKR